MTKNIAIMGSTGSIGTQALEVCKHLGIKISAIAAGSNIKLLEQQIRRYKPLFAAVADEGYARSLAASVADTPTRVRGGKEAMLEAVSMPEVDTVLAAIVGYAGLESTVQAIKERKKIALANKETLVTAGSIVMPLAKEYNVTIIPVDSEHSALFQVLHGNDITGVDQLLLTASGGPFRGWTTEQLKSVSREKALLHPNWSMGGKISIDSATMMNKGLEVIEAHWLFGVPAAKIEVVVHPESIIHSAISYIDGSIIAQMGAPDMRLPIQLALTWPLRLANPYRKIRLTEIAKLTFEKPDLEVFRCLKLATEALRVGGTLTTAMNAANEEAVSAFLDNRISFLAIPEVISEVMSRHNNIKSPDLEAVSEADREARNTAIATINTNKYKFLQVDKNRNESM